MQFLSHAVGVYRSVARFLFEFEGTDRKAQLITNDGVTAAIKARTSMKVLEDFMEDVNKNRTYVADKLF